MKKCPSCGYETEAKFCTECGFDLTEILDEIIEGVDVSNENLEENYNDNEVQEDTERSESISKDTKIIGKNVLGSIDKTKDNAFEKTLSKISLVISCVFTILGFYKMFAYENGEYSWSDKTNAYVGGDAYNYIINGTYATAFFVLAGSFLLASILLLILDAIKRK